MTQDAYNEITPAATGAIQVTLDTREVAGAVTSLAELLKLALQIRQGLLHVLDTPSNIGRLELHNLPAPGAAPLRATFQPTQRFLDLTTAVRTGNIYLRTIKEALSHISPPSAQPSNEDDLVNERNKVAPAATGAAEVRVVRSSYNALGQKVEEVTFTGTAAQVREAQSVYLAAQQGSRVSAVQAVSAEISRLTYAAASEAGPQC